jgi:hypothetical protein
MRKKLSMSDLKEKQKLAWEGMFYSIQRIDLLIISICGAGIYVCLEAIKYQSSNEQCVSLFVKVAGGFFLLGIIVNFLSQMFGYNTHKYDFLMHQSEIDAGDKVKKSEQKIIDSYDKKSDSFSKLTDIFNYSSMGAMFLGLILIMYFFLFTF